MAGGIHQRRARYAKRACKVYTVAVPLELLISRQRGCLPDTSVLHIIDLAAKRLRASSLARVAIINYAGADYDLRAAWSIRHDNLPQLRLFSTSGELPKIIPGLHKDGATVPFGSLTPAQQSMRAMTISSECMAQLSKHPDGVEVKRRVKSSPLNRRKTEL